MTLDELFKYAKEQKCSDIHITVGTNLAVRRFGELKILEPAPTAEESRDMIFSLLDSDQVRKVTSGMDLDAGCMLSDGSRIRINVYHQRNNIAASIRLLNDVIPTFRELNLPPSIEKMLHIPSGLVLITGPTGSGKTTTLASMIAQINKTRACHIMTIEDPIEYVFRRDKAMIHQREVGTDVESFSTALRSSLREDPDIILVGEMRDLETITAAINAAETGHLVFSTLHTSSAVQTIDRIIDACPLEGQNQMRSQLANVLRGIFSQQLIPMMDGTGRMVATEVLLNNTAVANLIREGKTVQITTALQSGSRQGMHTLNSELISLISMGFISREEAMKVSPNPSELERI